MRKFPYELFHIIYLPVAAILFLITCYYSTGLAEFEREEGFSKDLGIDLPEYIIDNRQVTSIYENEDESGLFLYDSLAYSIRLKEPLPDKSLRIITSERRGWKRVDNDTYTLRRSILSEVMTCNVDVQDCVMKISYLYDFDSFGMICYPILMSMALSIIYVIMLILLSAYLFVRSRLNKKKETQQA